MIMIASQIAQISQYVFELSYISYLHLVLKTMEALASREAHGVVVHWQGLQCGMAVRWGVRRWCVRAGQLGDVR